MMIQLEVDGKLRRIALTRTESTNAYQVSVDDGPEILIDAEQLQPGVLSMQIGGKTYRCVLEGSPEGTAVHLQGRRVQYRVDDPRSLKSRRQRQGGADGPKKVTAPMPGRVVRVLAKVGDMVEAHQGIVVIEAMKMQNELKSPKAGKVVQVRVEQGGTVSAGEVLAIVE
ncbi:biotin/lipoyl-containing protein [Acidobacterium sp. S8]|uniref:biotin/lipoyl-containing protein n=1 Tax=Acidobacterium sp. S8 TaxID=1641854 RepID=UPI00131CEE9F|nr:acetyl-CoA carboxylase biotin carboxyl carrier protein subunit [Acidobacterium sp. S8]